MEASINKMCILFTDVELEVNGNIDGGADRKQGDS